jgi:N-acetylneuraminic acid mutarotase
MQPRRGHSMVKYEDFIFMFGGIQDITKEKNDIYIFQIANSQWSRIHTTTNSIYDCSPTLKKSQKVLVCSFRRVKALIIHPKSVLLKNQKEGTWP